MKSEGAPMMVAFMGDCKKDCDSAFLNHMKMHHEQGIGMAEMAVRKTVHPQLKQLAERLIREQRSDDARFDVMLASLEKR
jgi:uncharacterized protein (DUF305 family)